MSKYRFLLIIPLVIVLLAAWYIVGANDGTKLQQQRELLAKAAVYAEDKVYVKAVPLAAEAYSIDTDIKYTEVEGILMDYYYKGEYFEEYYSVISDRINGGRASQNEYLQLAQYYLNDGERKSALDILSKAIVRYDSDKLPEYYGIKGLNGVGNGEPLYSDEITDMYEANRYKFSLSMPGADDIIINNGKYFTAYNKEKNMWALHSTGGGRLTEYLYSEATNMSADGFASVKLNGEYLLVDKSGVRYALCKNDSVTELIRTEGKNQTIVKCSDGKMYMATDMVVSKAGYDYIGAASSGFRAICKDGKWSFLGGKDNKIEGEYDEIKVNSCGEAVVSGRAFVKTGGAYKLIDVSGNVFDVSFEDAKPFSSGGMLAAVKNNGKWGFADKNGRIVIDCKYDDAISFCSAGAGMVKCSDGHWRIIDVRGNINEEYDFFDAKEFIGVSAAVQGLEDKWSVLSVN